MLNVDGMDDEVFHAIAKNMGLDVGDDAAYEAVAKLTFEQAWERYCVWHGLLGSFHVQLGKAYENLKRATRKKKKS